MQRSETGRDWLVVAAWAFLAANLIHTADHLRQGTDGVRQPVIVAGTAVTIAAVVCLRMAIKHHRHAAVFAAFLGIQAFFGIAASHIAPDWGFLSDSYPQIHADALSWAVMLLEMAAGLTLGLVGLHVRRRQAGHIAVPLLGS